MGKKKGVVAESRSAVEWWSAPKGRFGRVSLPKISGGERSTAITPLEK